MPLGNNTYHKHLKEDSLASPLVFWDTSFPMVMILEKGDRKNAAVEFAEKLKKNGNHIFFSSLLLSELYNAIVFDRVKEGEGLTSNNRAKEKIEQDPAVINKYQKKINEAIIAFQSLLGLFSGNFHIIFPTEPSISNKITEIKSKYQLKQGDAMHIGTMLASQQRDFVTFDSDFDIVDGINIWSKFD